MTLVIGNTRGLKPSQLKQLDKLSQRSLPDDVFLTPTFAEALCQLTVEWHQPITVMVDRKGRFSLIYVGTPAQMGEDPQVPKPEFKKILWGYRAIHTTLDLDPQTDTAPNRFDLTTLLQYRLDCMITMNATHHPQWSHQFGEHPQACDGVWLSSLSHEVDPNSDAAEERLCTHHEGPMTLHQLTQKDWGNFIDLVEADMALWRPMWIEGSEFELEKAYLVGIASQGNRAEGEDFLDELSLLAKTAGAMIVGRTLQMRPHADNKFYIGKGKAEELAFDIQQSGANLVICDDELTPNQLRQLEQTLRTRVIDRTQLILDIFAQRAQTHEGKLQVELAQLNYMLPRLSGQAHGLSQQTSAGKGSGTIATRGPGETKLEMDRRRLRERVQDLEKQAESVRLQRQTQRRDRIDNGMPVVALVGYTNAGKSTLLNVLTNAGVLAEDKLFATLDTTTRRLVRPGMPTCLLIDTVGLIQKLPTTLIKAFRSTLEEMDSAVLILHVVDASHPNREAQIESVQETLDVLGLQDKPQWMLMNKCDRLKDPDAEIATLKSAIGRRPVFQVSGQSEIGLDTFMTALGEFLSELPELSYSDS